MRLSQLYGPCFVLLAACATTSSESNQSATAVPMPDADLDEARTLFEAYETRSAAYDRALRELFDPEVVITTSRKGPDGAVRKQAMPPGWFYENFDTTLQLAELRRDQDVFDDVVFTKDAGDVVVRAKRTSTLKCYVDEGFTMHLRRRDDDAPLRIIAIESDTEALSSCPDGDVRTLAEQAALPVEGKLPINVDEETRLDSVVADESGLVYRFTFLTANETDVDGDALRSHMQKTVVAQSCLWPDLRPILDSGGIISYVYAWADGTPFTEFDVRETDCS